MRSQEISGYFIFSQETILLFILLFHRKQKRIHEKLNMKHVDNFVPVCSQRLLRFYPAAHFNSVHCRLQYEENKVRLWRRAETERDNISDGTTGVCCIFCCGNRNMLAAVL